MMCDVLYGVDQTQKIVDQYIKADLCCDDLNKDGYTKIVDLLRISGLKRSASEEKKTPRYKEKFEKTVLQNYGVSNPSQSKIVQRKKEETYKQKYGGYEDYLKIQRVKMRFGYSDYRKDEVRTRQQAEKCRETVLNRYGVDYVSQIPEVRKINSEKSKEWWSQFNYEDRLILTQKSRDAVCHRGASESSIERKVQKILIDNNITFDKHISMFGYNYDIFIFGDVFLEIQGDMWHANPKIYKEDDIIMGKILVSDIWKKDERKRKKVIDAGYRIIYLWEHEIRKLSDDLILMLIHERLQ